MFRRQRTELSGYVDWVDATGIGRQTRLFFNEVALLFIFIVMCMTILIRNSATLDWSLHTPRSYTHQVVSSVSWSDSLRFYGGTLKVRFARKKHHQSGSSYNWQEHAPACEGRDGLSSRRMSPKIRNTSKWKLGSYSFLLLLVSLLS